MEVKLTTVGVAGLGFMGRGIVSCLLSHGVRVLAYTPEPSEFATARASIPSDLDELVERAGFHPSLRDNWHGRYTESTSLSEFAACDFVIESIIEDADAKASLFAALEDTIAVTTPIASNTSSIPISLLQRNSRNPERILGMHWAIPAHATRFLELIRGEFTNDDAMQKAFELAKLLEKEPCVVQKDVPGFVANRIGYAMYREACHLIASGVADAATIDRAFRNTIGLWASVCGPFQWIDLTGGPALYGKAMSGVLPTLSCEAEVPEPLKAMMQRGDNGVRGGHGFYDYTPEQVRAAEAAYREQVWRVRGIPDLDEPTPAVLRERS